MSTENNSGWVLYDNECGVCRSWVPRWKKLLNSIGLEIATLQDDWVKEKIDLDQETLMRDIQLITEEGILYSGADAYRYVMKRVWWLYPMFVVACAPITRSIFNFCYRAFADNRHRISKSCKL